MTKRELYWLLTTFVITLIGAFVWSGTDKAIDLNIHDAYFVVAIEFFWIVLFVVLFFISYLIRFLIISKTDKFSVLLLALSIASLVLIAVVASRFVFGISDVQGGIANESIVAFWKNTYNIFLIVNVLLISLLIYVSFQLGKGSARASKRN